MIGIYNTTFVSGLLKTVFFSDLDYENFINLIYNIFFNKFYLIIKW